MSNETSQQPEPTMEEILASIRRIISDGDEPDAEGAEKKADDGKGSAAKAEAGNDNKDDDGDEEVLDLIEMVEEPAEVAADSEDDTAEADAEDDLVLEDTAEELPAEGLEKEEDEAMASTEETGQPAISARGEDDGLVSTAAAAASTAHFAELAKAVDREPQAKANIALGSGGTLEDIVKDMIRPMLKEWLDQNLPPLVDHLVRKEIQRMVNRADDI
jgi:cell pole-organizing protein PopZ